MINIGISMINLGISMINIGISMINLLGISMINIGISMINFGISMISILMIDMSKNLAGWILAGWISSWVENDLGGFCLGGKWLKVWVDFVGWKTARGLFTKDVTHVGGGGGLQKGDMR